MKPQRSSEVTPLPFHISSALHQVLSIHLDLHKLDLAFRHLPTTPFHPHLDPPAPSCNAHCKHLHYDQENHQIQRRRSLIADGGEFRRRDALKALPFACPRVQSTLRCAVRKVVGNNGSEDGGEQGGSQAEEGEDG